MSAPKKLRMPNFTEPEITALVDGYEENKIAIEAKGDGPHGSQAKRRAWDRITATMFAVSGIRREVADVKTKWADYKSANKIRGAAVRRSQTATGGGPGEPDLTEAEERVIGLLSEDALVGIEGAFDIGVRPARQSDAREPPQAAAADRGSVFISPIAFVADPAAGPSSAPEGWPVHSNLEDVGHLYSQSPNRGESPAVPATTTRPASVRPGSARPESARPAAARAAAARAANASTAEKPAGSPATIRQSSNDEVGHDILKAQMAILAKLDLLVSEQQGLLATQQQLLVTQQQLVSLKAHKYGVHFDDKSS